MEKYSGKGEGDTVWTAEEGSAKDEETDDKTIVTKLAESRHLVNGSRMQMIDSLRLTLDRINGIRVKAREGILNIDAQTASILDEQEAYLLFVRDMRSFVAELGKEDHYSRKEKLDMLTPKYQEMRLYINHMMTEIEQGTIVSADSERKILHGLRMRIKHFREGLFHPQRGKRPGYKTSRRNYRAGLNNAARG